MALMRTVRTRYMDYDTFVTQVQDHLSLAGSDQAIDATDAVLTTLGERLDVEEAVSLAEELPTDLERFLLDVDHGQRFTYMAFLERVSDRGGVSIPEANYHTQQIVALLETIDTSGTIETVRDRLPHTYGPMFGLVDHGHRTDTPAGRI